MNNMLRCITINTDASFKNKIGSYAFYIVCDRFKIQKGGYFKKKVENSTDAETMAIANALHTLLNNTDLVKTKLIVINTDSKGSIDIIKSKKYNNSADVVRSIQDKIIKEIGCKIQYRHVKAHSGKETKRKWVNDWCDKEAKRWRIIREEQLGIRY